MGYKDMSLQEIVTLPGVKDLPLKVKGRFAQALKAEDSGRHADASKLLDQAVEAEG